MEKANTRFGLKLLVPVVLCVLVAGVLYLDRGHDGVGLQGDSPRHAMNGVFWGDFLKSGDWFQPKEYALAYYEQFPAIAPTLWPPFFYGLEAGLYEIFGVTPLVGRGLVLVFTFVAMGYLALLVLALGGGRVAAALSMCFIAQPSFVQFASAVMLDVPALALGLGAIYHLERATQSEGRRHLALAVFLTVLATLTRQPGFLLPLSYGLALLFGPARRRLVRRDALLLYGAGALLVAPWVVVNVKYGAIMLREAVGLMGQSHSVHAVYADGIGTWIPYWSVENALYYARALPGLVAPWFAGVVLVGVSAGLLKARTRAGVCKLLIAATFLYTGYSALTMKEARYVLGLLPILAAAAAIGLGSLLQRRRLVLFGGGAGLLLLCVWSIGSALPKRVNVRGIQAAATDVLNSEDRHRVLYDGYFDGVFVLYARAHPEYESVAVVRGGKLFYETALRKSFGMTSHVDSEEDVLARIADSGCRWLLVEREDFYVGEPARLLRRTVETNELFRLERTYPISTSGTSQKVKHLDLYEYVGGVSGSSFKSSFKAWEFE